MSKSKRRSGHRTTFRQIMEDLGKAHAEAIFARAKLFNRIARSARRLGQRQLAYRCKARCLGHLLKHCPQHAYAIRDDIAYNDPGLMLVKMPGLGGLHSRRRWLDAA